MPFVPALGMVAAMLCVSGASALVFSPDGKVLAERGADGTIRLYDPAKGAEMRQLTVQVVTDPRTAELVAAAALSGRAGGSTGPGMVFSPDGQLLASSGGSAQTAMFVGGGVGAPPGRGGPAAVITLFDVGTGNLER